MIDNVNATYIDSANNRLIVTIVAITKHKHFIASVNWFVGNFRGKVPIECYIRLFQSYCSTHYGSILWPLHERGFNDFCVTWNKGVRRRPLC